MLLVLTLVQKGVSVIAVGVGRGGRQEGGGVEVREAARGRGAMVVVKRQGRDGGLNL